MYKHTREHLQNRWLADESNLPLLCIPIPIRSATEGKQHCDSVWTYANVDRLKQICNNNI